MLRLRPTVISLTMAEVKEVERRRLFHKHLEQTMALDKSDFRQRQTERLMQDMMPVPVTSTSTVRGQASTVRTCSEKGTAMMTSRAPEEVPPATSPLSSPTSDIGEVSDEELLPLPDRPRRRATPRRAVGQTERRHFELRPRVPRAQRSPVISGRDPPTERPSNPSPGRPEIPHAVAPIRSPRSPGDGGHSGFVDSSHTVGRGRSELSFMTDDEILAWASSPIDLARPSSLDVAGLASARQARSSSDDGQMGTPHRYLFRNRERRTDARRPDPARQPSAAGTTSSPTAPRTPGRFQIYNDSLPASSQPQTPQNLPEARHQSRLRGSWTAPPRGHAPYPHRTPTSRVRRAHGRRANASPPGLQTPGFMGLYGGIENTDDSVLFEESTRELDPGGSHDAPPSV